MNTSLSSKIFKTDESSYNFFKEEKYGNYNMIKYNIDIETSLVDVSATMEKVIDSQAINENGKLKINATVIIKCLSKKNILDISFYLEDLFNTLKKDNKYYYVNSSIF